MSEEIGVDVERIGQLASALENLRNVLAANVPTIVNTMEEYWSSGTGSPISLQSLKQAQARSVEDATSIRDRSIMAVEYQNQVPAQIGNMVPMPWDASPAQLNADAEQAAVQELASAEALSKTNPQLARAQIQNIQADIQDHLTAGDTAWLTSFYNAASPQVANLAAVLNGEDGQTGSTPYTMPAVLTKQDQQILNTFASGLAAADKTGNLTQATIGDYANAKNLWSVGMLFKFGPSGSAYGTQPAETITSNGTVIPGKPNLLAQVTTSIEMARTRLNGYVIPLNGPDVPTNAVGIAFINQPLTEFDPAQAMLTLAAQNGAAARQVLAGPDGKQIAASLMTAPNTTHYQVFGSDGKLVGFAPDTLPVQFAHGQPLDYSGPIHAGAFAVPLSPNVVASFFNAATAAPRGTDAAAYESANAAMNLIQATPPPSTASLPAAVQSSLLTVAQRYILDLGISTTNTSATSSMVIPLYNKAGQPWFVSIAHNSSNNVDPLATFLQQITSNPTTGGILMASAKTQFGQYYGLLKTNKLPAGLNGPDGIDPAMSMAKLMGQIQTQSNNVGIQGAQETDARNAEYNALLSFAESEAGKIPVVGSTIGNAQTAAGLLGINLPSFSTDNAANAYASDQQNFALQQLQINVPMAQALLNNGVLSAKDIPSGQTWYKNGQITLSTSADANEFNAWYSGVERSMESDVTNYQNAMGLQQSSSLTDPVP